MSTLIRKTQYWPFFKFFSIFAYILKTVTPRAILSSDLKERLQRKAWNWNYLSNDTTFNFPPLWYGVFNPFNFQNQFSAKPQGLLHWNLEHLETVSCSSLNNFILAFPPLCFRVLTLWIFKINFLLNHKAYCIEI